MQFIYGTARRLAQTNFDLNDKRQTDPLEMFPPQLQQEFETYIINILKKANDIASYTGRTRVEGEDIIAAMEELGEGDRITNKSTNLYNNNTLNYENLVSKVPVRTYAREKDNTISGGGQTLTNGFQSEVKHWIGSGSTDGRLGLHALCAKAGITRKGFTRTSTKFRNKNWAKQCIIEHQKHGESPAFQKRGCKVDNNIFKKFSGKKVTAKELQGFVDDYAKNHAADALKDNPNTYKCVGQCEPYEREVKWKKNINAMDVMDALDIVVMGGYGNINYNNITGNINATLNASREPWIVEKAREYAFWLPAQPSLQKVIKSKRDRLVNPAENNIE